MLTSRAQFLRYMPRQQLTTPRSESSRIVLEIPPLPATEVLLVVIIVLCICTLRLLREAVGHLRAIALRKADTAHGEQSTRYSSTKRPTGLAASAVKGSVKPFDRELRRSAEKFQECFLGDSDVDVKCFIGACRHFGDCVLAPMGAFTILSVHEIHANMDKIKHSYQVDPEKNRSLRTLLKAEIQERRATCAFLLQDICIRCGVLRVRALYVG